MNQEKRGSHRAPRANLSSCHWPWHARTAITNYVDY